MIIPRYLYSRTIPPFSDQIGSTLAVLASDIMMVSSTMSTNPEILTFCDKLRDRTHWRLFSLRIYIDILESITKRHSVLTNSKNYWGKKLRTFAFIQFVAVLFDINHVMIAMWKRWDNIKL